MEVRLHDMRMHTKVLGPGTRTAIWFQGCNRRCKGCMSPLSRPIDGGKSVAVEKVVSTICDTADIEGITISGGEPFLQIDALHAIVKDVKMNNGLGVIIYTGYTLGELKSFNNPKVDEIVDCLADIIIDGEYIDELNDGRSLKGSSNQIVHFITERYLPYKEIYETQIRNTEVIVDGNETFLIGVPNKDSLEEWKKIVGNRE